MELWTRQFRAAQTEELDSMQRLGDWLAANVPAQGRTSIVHLRLAGLNPAEVSLPDLPQGFDLSKTR